MLMRPEHNQALKKEKALPCIQAIIRRRYKEVLGRFSGSFGQLSPPNDVLL
jgi:hypothetical protein